MEVGSISAHPPPPQAPVQEGMAEVGGARLWYWDTGGSGDAIVLLHPATGSGAVWGYQQPVFAAAGYRVIGYSRRGHYKSESGPHDRPGTASGDANALADFLELDRFHLLGTAAGGFAAADYAVSYPDRLLSLILASTQGGAQDPAFRETIACVAPPEFIRMPASFRELGPSYRAAYRDGVALWEALEHQSLSGPRIRQPTANQLSWERIETIRVPTLMFTGDADLYMPPAMMHEYARHIRNCETAVIAGAGHSAYWEQPDAFNRLVLDFIGRHRA